MATATSSTGNGMEELPHALPPMSLHAGGRGVEPLG